MDTPPSPQRSAGRSRRSQLLWACAFFAAAVITLIAAVYIIEDWRGLRAWDRCLRDLKAQGEPLDWSAFVPPRVPDDQNFAKTPLLEAVGYKGSVDTNVFQRLNDAIRCLDWDASGDFQSGKKVDWASFEKTLRRHGLPDAGSPAEQLLRTFEGVESDLDELRIATVKPFAQFDIDRTAPFEETRDFNLVAIRQLSQLLAFHASAELALDQPQRAFVDVRAIHRLADSLRDENTLVALMISVAMEGLALEPFWEGWADRRWTDREYAAFEQAYARVDLLPKYTHVINAERAGVNTLVEKYGIRGNEFSRVTMRNEPAPGNLLQRARWNAERLAWRLVPKGWICQNLVAYNRRMQAFRPASLQAKPATVSPAEVNAIKERLPREIPGGPYGWLSRAAIPNFGKAIETVARIQTTVNQARIVCALERCRLATGQYPPSLAELTPGFLAKVPVDVINGQPMKYLRTADGRFQLYSVGWNEVDDGGAPPPMQGTAARPDFTQGDWVWRYPQEK